MSKERIIHKREGYSYEYQTATGLQRKIPIQPHFVESVDSAEIQFYSWLNKSSFSSLEITICFSDLVVQIGYGFAILTLIRLYINSMLLKSIIFLKLLLFGRIINLLNPYNTEPTATEYYLEHIAPSKYTLLSILQLLTFIMPLLGNIGDLVFSNILLQAEWSFEIVNKYRPWSHCFRWTLMWLRCCFILCWVYLLYSILNRIILIRNSLWSTIIIRQELKQSTVHVFGNAVTKCFMYVSPSFKPNPDSVVKSDKFFITFSFLLKLRPVIDFILFDLAIPIVLVPIQIPPMYVDLLDHFLLRLKNKSLRRVFVIKRTLIPKWLFFFIFPFKFFFIFPFSFILKLISKFFVKLLIIMDLLCRPLGLPGGNIISEGFLGSREFSLRAACYVLIWFTLYGFAVFPYYFVYLLSLLAPDI